MAGDEAAIDEEFTDWARHVRAELAPHVDLAGKRVLEVGSGAHGLVFFLGLADSWGIDPLADDCRRLFPRWQNRASTVAAPAERLPFPDAHFDVVLCDNVVDHALDPGRIVAEIARVLAPGGVLYFSVNVHHPAWALASALYGVWWAVGLPGEVSPFADHTFHLTPRQAEGLVGDPFEVLDQAMDLEADRLAAATLPLRHLGDLVSRVVFKNASCRIIARRR